MENVNLFFSKFIGRISDFQYSFQASMENVIAQAKMQVAPEKF